MDGAEALTRLIAMGDELIGLHESHRPVMSEEADREKLAVTVGQAMLNTMLPIARFRVHVEVQYKGEQNGYEYTICAVTPAQLRNALLGLSMEKCSAYVTLWEQKPLGAEMLAGYQGMTKTLQYRNFLKDMDRFIESTNPETVQ